MRLTKEMREEIIAKAMAAAFDKRDKAHDKATTALADALYAHEYPGVEKIVTKLPQGFCNRSQHISIEAAGFGWRRHEGLKPDSIKMSKERPVPHYRHAGIKVGGAHPLNDQAQAVADEYQVIKRDKEALRAKLSAMVYAVTTVPKLLEAWPECEKFVLAGAPKVSTSLVPVQLVPELNAALGLKPFRKAA